MTAQSRPAAAEVARALAQRIGSLAPELLPAGTRKGHYWSCGGVDGLPGKSLAIHLTGRRAGKWQDYATGEFGDALDLLAACRCAGDKKAAYAAACQWLGWSSGPPPAHHPVPAREERAAAGDDDTDRRRDGALAMWLNAQARILDTPVDGYLAGRGIDLRRLGRQPRALRYHPRLFHRPSGLWLPAMVAAISGEDGSHVATHRTWLGRGDGGAWIKARVADPKLSYGSFPGGSIRLWRGASRKPLRDAPADEPIAIGEGIETCLSVALACPELRILCAVSLGNLGGVWLPPQVRMVILLQDNDAKPTARLGFQRAAQRLLDRGLEVRAARSPFGKDFNDAIRSAA